MVRIFPLQMDAEKKIYSFSYTVVVCGGPGRHHDSFSVNQFLPTLLPLDILICQIGVHFAAPFGRRQGFRTDGVVMSVFPFGSGAYFNCTIRREFDQSP